MGWIISKNKVDPTVLLQDMTEVAYNKCMQLRLEEEPPSEEMQGILGIEFTIKKHYSGVEQFFYVMIEFFDNPERIYQPIYKDGDPHHILAVVDALAGDSEEDGRLTYEFCLGYLSLNSDHYVAVRGDPIFSLNDMRTLERDGGYRKGWWVSA